MQSGHLSAARSEGAAGRCPQGSPVVQDGRCVFVNVYIDGGGVKAFKPACRSGCSVCGRRLWLLRIMLCLVSICSTQSYRFI